MHEFGKALLYYRRQSTDPERGGPLTQERLAEILSLSAGIAYTGAAISEWERGKAKINKDDRSVLVGLLQALVTCGGMKSLEEANHLLSEGNYRALNDQELEQLIGLVNIRTKKVEQRFAVEISSAVRTSTTLWPPHIPREPYYPLPGREKDLNSLVEILHLPESLPIVVIDGLGGLGKTALSIELAQRVLLRGKFQGIVGDSAKQEILVGGEIVQIRDALLDLSSLFDAIARQLGHWEIPLLKTEEKQLAVYHLLNQQPYLIWVDNLETIENANALIFQVRHILGKSHAIVTSRKKVRYDFTHNLSLQGLELSDSLYFLQTHARQRKVTQILQASQDKLVEIHEMTGGGLLAMKLIVAQTQYLSLDQTLKQLSEAKGNIYKFVFRNSWNRLSLLAQQALIYIGRTVVTTVSWEELFGIGITESEAELAEAIDQLISYSLLEAIMANHEYRYGIHQLTRHFVNSDLPDIWRESGLM